MTFASKQVMNFKKIGKMFSFNYKLNIFWIITGQSKSVRGNERKPERFYYLSFNFYQTFRKVLAT